MSGRELCHMRGFRLGLLFAGTALAVVLAAPSMSAYAANAGDKVESLVPMPDTSPVPPPTAADVNAPPPPPRRTARGRAACCGPAPGARRGRRTSAESARPAGRRQAA